MVAKFSLAGHCPKSIKMANALSSKSRVPPILFFVPKVTKTLAAKPAQFVCLFVCSNQSMLTVVLEVGSLLVFLEFRNCHPNPTVPLNLKHRRRQRRNEADGNVVRTVLLGTDRSTATKTNAYGKVPRLSKIVYLSDYSLFDYS